MEKALQANFDELLFSVRRSIRYHVKRQQFFDGLISSTNFCNVVFGSAAVLAFLRGNVPQSQALTTTDWVGVWAAALVTILSSIELVVGYARKSRQHERLSSRFIELEKKMIFKRNNAEFSDNDLAAMIGERLTIEAEEPPPKLVLDSICHNELCRAEDLEQKEFIVITRQQRWLAQYFDLDPDSLRKYGEPKS
jgi:hypothetical protein